MRSTITVVAAALALGATAGAGAQEAAAKVGTAKVAVIDMQKVSSESQLGKSYAARIAELEQQIKNEGQKKQTELQQKVDEIRALTEDLQKQRNVLSPEGIDKKEQEIRAKDRDRKAFQEEAQIHMQQIQERAQQQAGDLNAEFQAKVRPHIEATARDLGVDILLDSQAALPINPAFDISEAVVARLDKAEPAAANAPAAAPAATPSGPSPSPKP